MRSKPSSFCLLGLIATLSACQPASAASRYWDVNGTAAGYSTVVGTWDGANAFWNTDATGGAGGSMVTTTTSGDDLFIRPATTNTGSLTVAGTQSASSITFVANVGPTTNITGGSIIIGGTGALSGIVQQSTGANTVSSALTLNPSSPNLQLSNTNTGLLTIGSITGAATSGIQTLQAGTFNTGNLTLNNSISDGGLGGKVALTVGSSGSGLVTLNGSNVSSLTGGLGLNGGTLVLNFANLTTPTNLINSGNALSLGGGTLSITGKSSGTTNQSFAGTTVNAGGGQILGNKNGGTALNLALGSLTSSVAGGSLLVGAGGTAANLPVITTLTNKNAQGLYSGRVVHFNGTASTGYDWATTVSGTSPYTLSGLATGSYSALNISAGSDSLNSRNTGTQSLSGNRVTHSLKIENPAAAQTLSLGSNLLTLSSGGLLVTGTNATTLSGNTGTIGLTAGNGSGSYDLIVHQFNSGGLTVSAVVGDNGSNPVNLVKAGSGTLTLSGINTFTGTTFVNGGTLAVSGNLGSGGIHSGNITIASGATFSHSGGSDQTYSGSITGLGGLSKSGSSTITLSGTNSYGGNTSVTGGTLNLTGTLAGSTGALALGTTAASTVVNVSGNLTILNLTGAAVAGSSVAYNQTSGAVTTSQTGAFTQFMSGNATGFGCFNLTGGSFTTGPGNFSVQTNGAASAYVGGTGVLNLTASANNTIAFNAGIGSLTVGPGGSVIRSNGSSALYLFTNQNSTGILNVAGGNVDLGTGLFRAGNGNTAAFTGMTGFINLAGGTLTMGSVTANNSGGGNSLYANYAGGTLKAAANLTNPVVTSNGVTTISMIFGPIDNPGTSSDFVGGLTVDTNGFSVSYSNPLRGAAGNGVTQAAMTISGGSGYLGAPTVTFTGGTLSTNGTPASGYAIVSGGSLTGIVITSPGTYTVAPTVTLTGGGGTGASVTLGALTGNASDSGLTKIGNGTLTLSGANSYLGPTMINAGTLALGANNVLPASPLTIRNGTLNAATFSDTTGTLDVAGNAVINLDADAALEFSNTSAIDWSGGTLTITGTFVSGNSLRFGTTSSGLTPAQLALISIPGGSPVALDSNGFLVDTANSPYISGFQSSAPFVQGPATPTLSWSIGGAVTSLTIEPGIGDVLPLTSGGSGSIAISPPLGEQTYTLTLNGTVSQSISIVSLPPKNKVHLYLLIGQSNMQGIGSPYSATLDAAVPRVVKFGSRNGMESVWVKGGHPLTGLTSTGGSVGMGLEFAKTMLAANSDPEVVIGLINHGLGSTRIEWWAPGAIDDQQVNPVTNQNYRLYDEAVQRVNAASEYGVLKGVLWHQGESNSGTQTDADAYAGLLQALVSNLRSSFNNPTLPFVCGKFVPATWTYEDGSPGAFTGLPYRAITEGALMDLPNQRPYTYCADNNGLRARPDQLIHFDAYSQRLFGQRYAAGMLGIQTGLNHPPVATPQGVSTAEDAGKSITLVATDSDSDPLVYSIATQPSSGTLSGTPPNLNYTPAADFNGADSFTFTASDGISHSAPATVSITVTPVNDAPVLAAFAPKLANEGVQLTFTASATDPDRPGDSLTYSLIGAPTGAAIDPASGAFTWTPSAVQSPGDYQFSVRVSDGYLTDDKTVDVGVSGVFGDPMADEDGDGIANLIEYGLGTSQTSPSAPTRLPVAAMVNGKLTVSYLRPVGGTPGVAYTLQTQSQLSGSWSAATVGIDFTQTVVDQGNGSEMVTARFILVPPPANRSFVRLSVSIP